MRTRNNVSLRYSQEILNGPVIATFLRLGVPLLIVRIIQDLYLLVDMFWLSRYNQFIMATPRQVMPSYMMFTAFINSFCSANLALLTQYIGAGMYDNVLNTFRKMITISVLGGLASGSLFFTLSPYLFTYFVGTPPEILADVIGYARVMAFDIIVLSINVSLATLLQSLGDTRTTALSQITGSIINLMLDPIFINGLGYLPAMGAVGAAIATLLSKFASIFMMIFRISQQYSWIKIRFSKNVDVEYLAISLRIATPLLIMGVSNSLAFNLQNRLINTFGVIVTTAVSLGFILFDLANTSLWGLTEGIAIMVGQNLGAGNIDRSKTIARKTALFIFSSVVVSSILIYLVKDYIASVFITGQGVNLEHIEKVYNEFSSFISFTIWTLAFFALTFSSMSVGRGSGRTFMPTVINIIRLWGLRVGLGYLLSLVLRWGTLGIYIAFALSNVIGGILSISWVIKGSWAKPIIKPEPKRLSYSYARTQ
uniref:MATE family efflux transporter n=1 Tax=Ignisphaera aggregans TaxID=334771 RepID=A0A7C4JJL6_9CREN